MVTGVPSVSSGGGSTTVSTGTLPYTWKYWRAFNLAIFAVEPPTKILAVLNLAIFSYA